jgi:ParB-like chromosome segregation protein Spo0J
MEPVALSLENIYVPVKRRKTLDAAKVETIAESIMEQGLENPIHVRQDKDRYVLVAGLHRLEAMKALGEAEIEVFIVGARLF